MVGRKEGRLAQPLEVRVVPSVFRCPISLDVMRSPVSLCTGVTYDRASIQRWLDSGHTTCPATMLPLPSTDLVPNLTLQRLIRLWSSSPPSSSVPAAGASLLSDLRHAADPLPALRRLSSLLSDDDVDDFEKNALAGPAGCAPPLAALLRRKDGVAAAAVGVLALILTSDCIEEANKKITMAAVAADRDASVSALVGVLKSGSGLEVRIDAARVVESLIAADPEALGAIVDLPDLVGELVRLVGETDDMGAVETGLACLAGICGSRRARGEMVRCGAVAAAARALSRESLGAVAAGRALRVMEAAAGCAEGREAICEEGEGEAVRAVVGRMIKAGREGAEAAVGVLWAVCHRQRDRRAVEAAAAAEGSLTKLLLLMQSGCSAGARAMAADLLKLFKAGAKSRLAGYDTKTTHIMPF